MIEFQFALSVLAGNGRNMLKEHKLPAGIVYFCRALPSGQLEHIPCVPWRYLAAFWPSAQAGLL